MKSKPTKVTVSVENKLNIIISNKYNCMSLTDECTHIKAVHCYFILKANYTHIKCRRVRLVISYNTAHIHTNTDV